MIVVMKQDLANSLFISFFILKEMLALSAGKVLAVMISWLVVKLSAELYLLKGIW